MAILISAALLGLTVNASGRWSSASGAAPSGGGRSRWPTGAWTERCRRWGELGPTLDGNPILWREWHRRLPSRWARIIWGTYVGLAVGFGAIAIHMALTQFSAGFSGLREIPASISGFQVATGLLLLSVSSATSLSEERVRGSLDVLLATPLPTTSVLRGKWWGAYRSVILMAILPGLIACLSCCDGRWIGPPLVVGLVLAYGAAITSLGLALATWNRPLGRVLTLCVGAYVGVSAGILFMAVDREDWGPTSGWEVLCSESPS